MKVASYHFRLLAIAALALALCVFGLGCAGGGTDGTGLDVRVSGTLIDSSGMPLANVEVRVAETLETVLTNEIGEFLLAAPAGATLVFSVQQNSTEFSLAELEESVSAVAILFEYLEDSNTVRAIEVVVEETRAPSPRPTTVGVSTSAPQATAVATNPPVVQPTAPVPATGTPQQQLPTATPVTGGGTPQAPTPMPTSTPVNTATPVFQPSPTRTPTPIPTFALGDLNCDGAVNCGDGDAMYLAIDLGSNQYELTYPNCNRALADINQDGSVNNFDINAFLALVEPC